MVIHSASGSLHLALCSSRAPLLLLTRHFFVSRSWWDRGRGACPKPTLSAPLPLSEFNNLRSQSCRRRTRPECSSVGKSLQFLWCPAQSLCHECSCSWQMHIERAHINGGQMAQD